MTDVIVRIPEVVALTGLSRTTIWRRMRARRFPAALALGDPAAGDRAIGWYKSDIEAWMQDLRRNAYGVGQAETE